jgi:hypothetical protein
MKTMREFFSSTLRTFLCAALAVSAGSVLADDVAKENKPEPDTSWMKDVTLKPRGRGHAPEIRPCVLKYKLSWRKLVSAGNATVEIKQGDPGVLVGEAEAKSSGLARALYTYDCELNARVDADSLKPLGFEHSETEKDETTDYETEFGDGWVRTWTTEPNEKGEVERKRRTYYYGEALDLLSTIFYVRSMPLKKGDKITRVVQPFDRPYLVSFIVEGREERKFEGEKIPTIKLSVQIARVNKDLSLKQYDKMTESSVWVSDDEFRLPIEIRADIFIGYITCLLESRQFTDAKAKAAAVAARAAGAKPNMAEGQNSGGATKARRSLGDRFRAIGSKLRGGGDKERE